MVLYKLFRLNHSRAKYASKLFLQYIALQITVQFRIGAFYSLVYNITNIRLNPHLIQIFIIYLKVYILPTIMCVKNTKYQSKEMCLCVRMCERCVCITICICDCVIPRAREHIQTYIFKRRISMSQRACEYACVRTTCSRILARV